MNLFRDIQNVLTEIGTTVEEMDRIWEYMYDKNWKVKAVTDSEKDWSDLAIPAIKSLIEQYNKVKGGTP